MITIKIKPYLSYVVHTLKDIHPIMFFFKVPFIQMHIMINISLDLLIGIWIMTNIFIMNKTMW